MYFLISLGKTTLNEVILTLIHFNYDGAIHFVYLIKQIVVESANRGRCN